MRDGIVRKYLQNKVSKLENQKAELVTENKHLSNELEEAYKTIDVCMAELENIRKEIAEKQEKYQEKMREIMKLKKDYQTALYNLYLERKDYENEVESLIVRIKGDIEE